MVVERLMDRRDQLYCILFIRELYVYAIAFNTVWVNKKIALVLTSLQSLSRKGQNTHNQPTAAQNNMRPQNTSNKSRAIKLVSEVLVICFFASAVLQFNDEDLAIWGTFYTFHAVLAASYIFQFGNYMFSIAMGIWSGFMVGLSLTNDWGEVTTMEELAGAVLGLVSVAYHASLSTSS